jgi:quercetin dioxygenase-like cupin family protein
MNVDEFERQMAREGFSAPIAGEYEPHRFNDAHAHAFEVRGLIVRGEMTITPVGGVATRYRAGEIFVMPLAAQHREQIGPDGCAYIWGKRETAAG